MTHRAVTAATHQALHPRRGAARLTSDDPWPQIMFSPPLHSVGQASSRPIAGNARTAH